MPFVFSIKVSLVTIIKFAREKKKNMFTSPQRLCGRCRPPGQGRPSKRVGKSLSYSQELRQTHECDTWSMRV